MPLKLDVKRKLLSRSDRVKSVDLHPSESWMVCSLYNGNVHIWNYENQQLVKSFEVCDIPVRAVRFVARKNWIVTGSDDMHVRVYNYNTFERVHQFEAHSDYLRCIAVHSTQPYILTCSDDMSVKLWDWENKWTCKQVFEGHSHYVMQCVINPKDNNTFATASLDRTVKVWQLGSNVPNFTLEGHEKGVNCVDYYHGGDKPYLISGADDRLVKIWDYQNKTCVATLDGHAQNVSAVCFHPDLPIILTGSEDSTVRIWHSNTNRLETTLNYGLERVWAIAALKGTNSIAIGYDEGSVIIKLGREDPAVSMDSSGKIIWAHHSEIQQANLKTLGADSEVKDGERLPLAVKEMGSCEVYPQTIQHNPNGRFVVVCGDGEYIIYTAMALRNKAYGSAQEFVWSSDSNVYAVRESSSSVKIFKNFKEVKAMRPDFGAEGIFGGAMLGVRSAHHLSFFDWETLRLIRRIEISPKSVVWSEGGHLVAIICEDVFYVLRYQPEKVAEAGEGGGDEDGIEEAFDVGDEMTESIRGHALWIGDCLVYTTSTNRLNYYVGGEIVTIAHLERSMYLLGYMVGDNRLYLCDKDLNVVSYSLLVSVLEYQTAVMRRDFDTANRVLPTIPKDQRTRVAHFLEKQGFKQQALAVSQDPEHKFDLALQLGDLKAAYELAKVSDSEEKWKQLARVATDRSELILAGECLSRAHDYGGLMLLASCAGSAHLMDTLATETLGSGDNNVAFMSNFVLGRIDACLDILVRTGRLPEAAFFARTYAPSQVPRMVELWKEGGKAAGSKAVESIASPEQYENLFPENQEALVAEKYSRSMCEKRLPAAAYLKMPPNETRNVLEEASTGSLSAIYSAAAAATPTPAQPTRPPAQHLAEEMAPPRPRSPVPPRDPSPRLDQSSSGEGEEDEEEEEQFEEPIADVSSGAAVMRQHHPPPDPDTSATAKKQPVVQAQQPQPDADIDLDDLQLDDGSGDGDEEINFDDDDEEWGLND